jgi:hypothetical protein
LEWGGFNNGFIAKEQGLIANIEFIVQDDHYTAFEVMGEK